MVTAKGTRDRHGRRPRGRRRRLRHEAVPAARAGRPHARGAAARAGRRRRRRGARRRGRGRRRARSTPTATRSRSAASGSSLPLKEFELLALLLENAGRVLTRDTLIDRVWGSDYVGDTKTLDVHIKRLRSKVESDPGKPEPDRHDPGPRLQVRHPEGIERRAWMPSLTRSERAPALASPLFGHWRSPSRESHPTSW